MARRRARPGADDDGDRAQLRVRPAQPGRAQRSPRHPLPRRPQPCRRLPGRRQPLLPHHQPAPIRPVRLVRLLVRTTSARGCGAGFPLAIVRLRPMRSPRWSHDHQALISQHRVCLADGSRRYVVLRGQLPRAGHVIPDCHIGLARRAQQQDSRLLARRPQAGGDQQAPGPAQPARHIMDQPARERSHPSVTTRHRRLIQVDKFRAQRKRSLSVALGVTPGDWAWFCAFPTWCLLQALARSGCGLVRLVLLSGGGERPVVAWAGE